MRHNLHIEWHLKFEVENGVKRWSLSSVTIHQRHEKCQVGKPFMQNMLLKTPMSLCRSFRG
jgi:hypothetical protein